MSDFGFVISGDKATIDLSLLPEVETRPFGWAAGVYCEGVGWSDRCLATRDDLDDFAFREARAYLALGIEIKRRKEAASKEGTDVE